MKPCIRTHAQPRPDTATPPRRGSRGQPRPSRVLPICCAVAALIAGQPRPALAGSELFPGISTGLPLGMPLPPGVWDVTQGSYGVRGGDPRVASVVVVPAWLIWSTPWTLAGGRLMFETVTPLANLDIHQVDRTTGTINTYLGAHLKWDLGGGLSGGIQSGVFLPVRNGLTELGISRDFFSFMEIAALTWSHAGWEATATGMYGTGRRGDTLGANAAPSWVNYDLTALRHVGKWEFGAVAYGSSDLSTPVSGYQRQGQAAAGALVGYQFGRNLLQLKLTREVAERHYVGGRETRVWFNLVVPLWLRKS